MFKKLRDYLYKKFLPWETREIYEREMDFLRKSLDKTKRENEELKAYIEGMTFALRMRQKVEINNEVNKG